MTLILASICPEGIIITGDGMVTRGDGTVRLLDYKKIRPLVDGIVFAAAGKNIPRGWLDNFYSQAPAIIDEHLKAPYTTADAASALARLAMDFFEDAPEDFKIGFVIAGYGKTEDGFRDRPLLCMIDSEKGYRGNVGTQCAIGDYEAIGLKPESIRGDIEAVAVSMHNIINEAATKVQTVGGEIQSIRIYKDTGKDTASWSPAVAESLD